MKTTSLFKAVALVAIMVASVLNSEVKAQDGFITNQRRISRIQNYLQTRRLLSATPHAIHFYL